MNRLDGALLTATKKQLVKKRVRFVKTRIGLGDLTIDEAGVELKLYMDRLDKFRSLEDLDTGLNR